MINFYEFVHRLDDAEYVTVLILVTESTEKVSLDCNTSTALFIVYTITDIVHCYCYCSPCILLPLLYCYCYYHRNIPVF